MLGYSVEETYRFLVVDFARTKIGMAASSLSQMDIRIDDNPTVTVADINAKCRRLDDLGLVIIDYLQLIARRPDREEPRSPRRC